MSVRLYLWVRMMIKTIALSVLAVLMVACTPTDDKKSVANAIFVQPQSAMPTITKLKTSAIGNAKVMAYFDDKLLIINDKNELWQWGSPNALAVNVSPDIRPVLGYDKLAFASTDGYLTLIDGGKILTSTLKLSPKSGLLVLPFAVIAVAEGGVLVRVERQGDKLVTVATFSPVLPDAQPILVNFVGDNTDGHIAVLSHPDTTTYRHGVLGDAIEAGSLQWLERHQLKPLVNPLKIDGLVFEANRLEILPTDMGNRLVGVMAGDGAGAKTVVVDKVGDSLGIVAQSKPLPINRWQSPFVFKTQVFAVQMPHLRGRLVKYSQSGQRLDETLLGEPYSNHKMGDFDTNLTASTTKFAVIPTMDYQQIGILDEYGNLTTLDTRLPDDIKQVVAKQEGAYLLLNNGQIWHIFF